MRLKIPILAAITLLTTIISAGPIYTPAAHATPGPLFPGPNWAPYGPLSNKIQFQFYTNEGTEFNDFDAGNLDLTDWPVPKARWASYNAATGIGADVELGQAQGEFGMFVVDFNMISSDWTGWGCGFDHGNSPCGAQIRMAISHLIDRPQWVLSGILGGSAQALADPTPPAKTPAGSTIPTQQSWDTDINGAALHSTINAFNVATDASGFALAGSADFCAAADHMLQAFPTLTSTGGTCLGNAAWHLNPSAGISSHPVRFMIRSDSPPRNEAGIGIMNGLNALFGTDIVAETYGDINQLGDIVFVSRPQDDWSIYTGGYQLGGPFPDHLYALYGSPFASDECGGRKANRADNYRFICVTAVDNDVGPLGAAGTDNLATFSADILAGLNEIGKRELTLPLYSGGNRFVALKDMTGRVDAKGLGYSNFYSLLTGRENPSFTPSNSLYAFSRTAGGDTIRWGQKQGITKLNMFHATTVWDFNVLGEIYDGLIATNPAAPDQVFGWMANGYTVCTSACGAGYIAGDTWITFTLRAGLTWQDNVPVTANDVSFSLLNYRDAPADNLLGAVVLLRDATVNSPLSVTLKWQGRSLSHILNSGVPIIPKHLWDVDNNGVVDADKFDPGFDPLAAGILIGSGAFACRSVFSPGLGTLGTGCGKNADGSRSGQNIGPGGSMLLVKYDFATPANPLNQYMRSYNPTWPALGTQSGSFQEDSWADRDDSGKVDITDVSSVAACFGKVAPDVTCPAATYAYWDVLGVPTDFSVEVATVAGAHLDDDATSPFSWNSLYNIVPFTP